LTNKLIDLTVRVNLSADNDNAVHDILRDGGICSGNIVHMKRTDFKVHGAPSSFGDTCCTKIRKKLLVSLLDKACPYGDGAVNENGEETETSKELTRDRKKADAIWEATNAVIDFICLKDDSEGLAQRKVSSVHVALQSFQL
jgi:hypothetical protein